MSVKMNDSALERDRDGVCAVLRFQLAQDILNVSLHGAGGRPDFFSNFFIS